MKEKKGHGVQLLIRAIVRDPDGKVIRDTGNKPARSFINAFLQFCYGMFNAVNHLVKSIDSYDRYITYAARACNITLQIDGGVNVSTKGLVVGTGDTAPTNADYKLETQLTQGAGAGNISHGTTVRGEAAEVGANVDLELSRAFTNNTGSTITVKEAGVYTLLPNNYHCIVRDVLDPAEEVVDKCSITIIYTVRTTV